MRAAYCLLAAEECKKDKHFADATREKSSYVGTLELINAAGWNSRMNQSIVKHLIFDT